MPNRKKTQNQQPPKEGSFSEYLASIPSFTWFMLTILSAGLLKHSRDSANNPCLQYFNLTAGDINNGQLYLLGELHSRQDESFACIRHLNPDIWVPCYFVVSSLFIYSKILV